MTPLTEITHGRYSVYFAEETVEPSLLIDALAKAPTIHGKGRGGISLVRVGPTTLACREYVHGGLFRAFTRDIFLSSRRAIREMEVTRYLRDNGFPVVEPFAVIVEKRFLLRRLYFLTRFVEKAVDLLEYLSLSGRMARMRAIRRLATHLYRLEGLGVYHPDLHLNNVLVTAKQGMIFLDFDKSVRDGSTKDLMIRMFWRLNRFAEKMERKGVAAFSLRERVLFLRTYRRLSGYNIVSVMEQKAGRKRLLNKAGWFVERLFYGPGK